MMVIYNHMGVDREKGEYIIAGGGKKQDGSKDERWECEELKRYANFME